MFERVASGYPFQMDQAIIGLKNSVSTDGIVKSAFLIGHEPKSRKIAEHESNGCDVEEIPSLQQVRSDGDMADMIGWHDAPSCQHGK